MTNSRPASSVEDGHVQAEAGEVQAHGHHRPVLVGEVMSWLTQGPPGLYLDGTAGGGGHAAALLQRRADCRVLAVDRDPEAVRATGRRLAKFGRRACVRQAFFHEACVWAEVREGGLAGALLDLGASSRQLDEDGRGFTFRRGAPLDMRMDPCGDLDAAGFLARATPAELTGALREGQAPRPAAVSARIVRRRVQAPLRISDDLVGALESALRRRSTHSEKARLFQALRIRVNDEFGALKAGLDAIRGVLRPGGVMVVISYHSGEDRIVKQAFRRWSDPHAGRPARLPVRAADAPPAGAVLAKKPVSASKAEAASNPRSRSARLRAWRRAA